MSAKPKVPAVEGLFTMDEAAPALLGTRCRTCGTFYFPAETVACRHPSCTSDDLEQVQLSRRGKVWSYTNACYAPPPPFVAKDPFKPFAIAAVELEKEALTILGQVVEDVGVEQLKAGMEMELVLGSLYEDDDNEYMTWQWRPVR